MSSTNNNSLTNSFSDFVSFLQNNSSLHLRHNHNHMNVSMTFHSYMQQDQKNQQEQQLWQDLCKKGVKIVEVGPRDGLQNESTFISTNDKLSFIHQLIQAQIKCIEVTSFVSPKWVPSMADSSEIVQGIQPWRQMRQDHHHHPRNPIFMVLIPNLQGLQKALDAGGIDQIAVFTSASEAFSQRNINCSIEESLQRFQPVLQVAQEYQIPVRGYISCVLGCPYQGHVEPSTVVQVAKKLIELGCFEISLGDTIGVGTPKSTIDMLRHVKTLIDSSKLAVHFHDTYGQAMANIYAALSEGVTTIDSSVSGLGGCPYASGASGNVSTEDVVYMLNGLGIPTGIDLEKLVDAGSFICNLLHRETRSKVAVACLISRDCNSHTITYVTRQCRC